MKSVRIVQQLASDTVRWQKDKYAQQQQQYYKRHNGFSSQLTYCYIS